MSAAQKRNIEETLGPNRAAEIFGPNWGENGNKMWRLASPKSWERVNGQWIQKDNEFFRQDLFDALLTVPGEDPDTFGKEEKVQDDPPVRPSASGTPVGFPKQQNDNPEPTNGSELLEAIRHKSYSGYPISDKALVAAEKFIPGVGKWMPGGKNGGLDLVFKYAAKQRRDDSNPKGWGPNPDYNHQMAQQAIKIAAM
jgi:hypothetical protein